jgi:hypothetical protein
MENVRIEKIEQYWFNIVEVKSNKILIEGRTSKKICVEQCRDKKWNLIN